VPTIARGRQPGLECLRFMLKNLDSLIIDNDVQGRTRLREVLRNIAIQSKVENARATSDALTILQSKKHFDCLFIASSFGAEEITSFLKYLSGQANASKMAIFLTLSAADVSGSLIASLFLNGVHGFVCPPYSADTILDVINAARASLEVKHEDSKKIATTAGFLIEDMMSKIDKLAELKAAGQKGGGYVGKELIGLSKSLRDLSEQLGSDYEQIVIEKLINAKPPVERPGRAKAKRKEIPLHPGVVIAQLISKRKLDKERVVAKIKAGPEAFEALLEAKASVTKEIAEDLARALGESPSHWLGLQRKFDQYKP
jgi:plasmid maintenance system antidote protein VapI